MPDTSLVMVFRYKGLVSHLTGQQEITTPSFALSGLRRTGRLIKYAGDTGNILVIFKEGGAHAFLKEPLNELFEASLPLDNFDRYNNLSVLEEQLSEAVNTPQRIAFIEAFLLSRLVHPEPDLRIYTALQMIRQAHGTLRLRELANTLYISQDAFEKRFRRIVGVSAKQFSHIIRMRNILRNGKSQPTLTQLAYDAGYFDQSHFNKDFKAFTGQTPTDFFRTADFW